MLQITDETIFKDGFIKLEENAISLLSPRNQNDYLLIKNIWHLDSLVNAIDNKQKSEVETIRKELENAVTKIDKIDKDIINASWLSNSQKDFYDSIRTRCGAIYDLYNPL
jgi:hypothetical protein